MQTPKIVNKHWRINHIYSIVNKQGQLVRFQENGIQRRINQSKSLRKKILKYRQGGVSTNEIINACDDVFFHRNRTACLLAHDNDGLETIFNIAKNVYKFMDERLKPRLDRGGGSKYEMVFPDLNSKIYADLEVRGGTINRLHVSEAAFADQSRIKATLEAVPLETGIVTMETTPNGMGNHFYRSWVSDDPYYEKLFFPWYIDPQYSLEPVRGELTDEERAFVNKAKRLYGVNITRGQIAFRRFKQSDLKELFAQEYPEDEITCFLASGGSPFDLTMIHEKLNEAKEPIEIDGALEVYKPLTSGRRYVIGCDTAEGVRSDYSVAVVIEVKTMEVVAVYRSNTVKPSDFALAIKALAERYTDRHTMAPLVAVERNNHGHAVLLALDDILGYQNLYRDERDKKIGWRTTVVSRPIMLDAFIEAIEEGLLVVNSKQALYECLTLVDNGGKIEAESGEHDDTVIAMSIALQMAIRHGAVDLYDNIADKILV